MVGLAGADQRLLIWMEMVVRRYLPQGKYSILPTVCSGPEMLDEANCPVGGHSFTLGRCPSLRIST